MMEWPIEWYTLCTHNAANTIAYIETCLSFSEIWSNICNGGDYCDVISCT